MPIWIKQEFNRGCYILEVPVHINNDEKKVVLSKKIGELEPYRLYFQFQIHEDENCENLLEMLRSLYNLPNDQYEVVLGMYKKNRIKFILKTGDPFSED